MTMLDRLARAMESGIREGGHLASLKIVGEEFHGLKNVPMLYVDGAFEPAKVATAILHELLTPTEGMVEAGARALWVQGEREGGNVNMPLDNASVRYWFNCGPDEVNREDAHCYRYCQELREQARVSLEAAIQAAIEGE